MQIMSEQEVINYLGFLTIFGASCTAMNMTAVKYYAIPY